MRDRLVDLQVPSLWLYGRSDPRVSHRYGARIADTLPRAEVEVSDDLGHVPQFELPGLQRGEGASSRDAGASRPGWAHWRPERAPTTKATSMSADVAETSPGWLPAEDLAEVRDRVPLVYVDAVPVRLDHLGQVEKVGLLLRAMPDGTVSRAIVSGRVLFGETVREALWRHLTKDLGPEADPMLPASPTPFTIAEYFPDPTRTGFHDPRQHAVSLAYVVPVSGDCAPAHDALEFSWLTVDEVTSPWVADEMTGGHDRLVRLALAHTRSLR